MQSHDARRSSPLPGPAVRRQDITDKDKPSPEREAIKTRNEEASHFVDRIVAERRTGSSKRRLDLDGRSTIAETFATANLRGAEPYSPFL